VRIICVQSLRSVCAVKLFTLPDSPTFSFSFAITVWPSYAIAVRLTSFTLPVFLRALPLLFARLLSRCWCLLGRTAHDPVPMVDSLDDRMLGLFGLCVLALLSSWLDVVNVDYSLTSVITTVGPQSARASFRCRRCESCP
jgi:hypothetical protein